nr:uncharacterized mitochondrial protein AtMg00810-like [Tanacetum cinerariifolium]
MTGNISFLSDFEEINGGYVAFEGNPKGGKITGKGKIKTGKLDFDDVYFVKELKFNLFSVSQMCDKKSSVLFTDTECVVLYSDYKMPGENNVLLRVLRENNMYNVDLKNIGKQHRASCKSKPVSSVSHPLQRSPEKFDGKADEGFLVGYSINSKAFRVFNSRTRIVQETLHINFLENKRNVTGIGLKWLFDIDTLTKSMNYQPIVVGNQPNNHVDDDATFEVKENENDVHVSSGRSDKIDSKKHDEKAKRNDKGKSHIDLSIGVKDLRAKFEDFSSNITNKVNAASALVNVAGPNPTNSTNSFNTTSPSDTTVSPNFRIARQSSFMDPSKYPDDPDMPELEDIVYLDDEEDVGAEADLSNLETNIPVSHILTTRVHKDHLVNQIIGDLNSAPQRRSTARVGNTQEEGIDYDEVFAPVARIEAIRLLLAYASFMGFKDLDYPDKVYKVVKALNGLNQAPKAWYETLANYLLENGFQRGKIDQNLFIKKKKGDILLVQVYVDDIIFGSTNKELCKAFEKLMKDKFQMSSMGELTFFLGLQVKQKDDGIFINLDKYVAKILRKSIIGSLMYLTSSRPDIMFAICACARFQVTPKVSRLHEVKRIFRYLKGNPHLGLWYLKDSPFNLVAYSDSDYAGASLDRKSTTRGCQFLGYRLISWQCKKQTVVATSSTKVEYVAAASCCAQVLWIQNQLLDYGFDQIVDFLNAHAIQNALVVNPTIYVSCIKQVVVSEDVIRRDLHLDDADGVECLPNECVSAKRTARKEFNCSMASVVICLATGVKTPLFASMLVQPQPQAAKEEEEVEKVAKLEHDKHTQALEILKLEKRVKKLEKKKRSKHSGLKRLRNVGKKIEEIDADEDVTLVDVETQEVVSVATKDVNAVEPTVFNDEEYEDKEENIDWNDVVDQVQERHINNIRKYQNLKKKPVSITQAKKNMIIYLKNMAGYKMEHFRGMTYDKVRPIFEREYKKVQTLFKLDKDVEEPKKKRVAEETLLQESFKKLKAVEVSDLEIHSEGSRTYWKIIRVGGITEAYQSFEDMLKGFDREDLVALWNLVKEKFSSAVPSVDKEKDLWVELKRLFEPDADDVL